MANEKSVEWPVYHKILIFDYAINTLYQMSSMFVLRCVCVCVNYTVYTTIGNSENQLININTICLQFNIHIINCLSTRTGMQVWINIYAHVHTHTKTQITQSSLLKRNDLTAICFWRTFTTFLPKSKNTNRRWRPIMECWLIIWSTPHHQYIMAAHARTFTGM